MHTDTDEQRREAGTSALNRNHSRAELKRGWSRLLLGLAGMVLAVQGCATGSNLGPAVATNPASKAGGTSTTRPAPGAARAPSPGPGADQGPTTRPAAAASRPVPAASKAKAGSGTGRGVPRAAASRPPGGKGRQPPDAASRPVPPRVRISRAIDRILSEEIPSRVRVSILVEKLATAETVYARQPKRILIPASNVKIVTAAAALTSLGPAFRFKTRVLGDKPIDPQGVLKGNIYLEGGADPTLVSETMWRLTRDLCNKGLRRVTGRLIYDDRILDRKLEGVGWRHHFHEYYRAYLAPIAGLSLNFNTVAITILPGKRAGARARIIVDPPTRYIRRVVNRVKTVRRGWRRLRIRLPRCGYGDCVTVKGRFRQRGRPRSYWRRISRPGRYAATFFGELLRRHGVRIPKRRAKRGKVPSRARELHVVRSATLASILWSVNKNSSNFTAEQVLKTMGAVKHGKPGTWAKGLKVVRGYLARLGIRPGSYKLRNGSGLGRVNFLSPHQIVAVLRDMHRKPRTRPEFLASLALAGLDGTVRRRFRGTHAAGNARVKTGTIDGVSALSGFVYTRRGTPLVFSILMNKTRGRIKRYRSAQDRIVALLSAEREL